MHLKIRSTTKITSPCPLVDSVFAAQGFKKKIKKDSQYYQLRLTDSITSASYEIQIPFYEINHKSGEPLYKIQEIIIYSISHNMKNYYIPKAIIDAAKEKVSEAFSYLTTSNTMHILP